ncbi:hypothetical protein EON65_54985 [archaeon]|nr:MAG: hypothetical protein EON65_54985 [archaeon]
MIKEEIREEIEALQAIYDDDFFERPPVWNLPSFAIKIAPSRDEKQEPIEAIGAYNYLLIISIFRSYLILVSHP